MLERDRPESPSSVRILFLADTHLGFDFPLKPRIQRRRRGDDFFNNYRLALSAARSERVDLVIHGGDVFYRSKVPQDIVIRAFSPLVELADYGIPIFIVPGNHERSRIPESLFALHENITIFDKPATRHLRINEMKLVLSGFPYVRNNIRENFRAVLRRLSPNRVSQEDADIRILCMHQIVEGARIGVQDYTFRTGGEVIRANDLPSGFDAILAGHIHRSQILKSDLQGRPLNVRVYYPGSIERTSFAERNEEKGYFIIELRKSAGLRKAALMHRFVQLPARPMVSFELNAEDLTGKNLRSVFRELLIRQDPDAVVRFRIIGPLNDELKAVLSARELRQMAPPTMNVTLAIPNRANQSGANKNAPNQRDSN